MLMFSFVLWLGQQTVAEWFTFEIEMVADIAHIILLLLPSTT